MIVDFINLINLIHAEMVKAHNFNWSPVCSYLPRYSSDYWGEGYLLNSSSNKKVFKTTALCSLAKTNWCCESTYFHLDVGLIKLWVGIHPNVRGEGFSSSNKQTFRTTDVVILCSLAHIFNRMVKAHNFNRLLSSVYSSKWLEWGTNLLLTQMICGWDVEN